MPIKAILIPTNLPDHFHHELPPEGFRPLEASDDELHRYGVLHRPDPRVNPKSAKLWRYVMSRVKRFVAPKLLVNAKTFHLPLQGKRILSAPSGLVQGSATSKNWSGLVITDLAPYGSVWGTWTVPQVQVPPGAQGAFNSSAWVGLGGDDNNNLLQAGTSQSFSPGDLLGTYTPWFEWFPQPEIVIQNFVTGPGHTVAFSVGQYGDGSGRGYFTAANLETGIAIPLTIIPIPTTDSNGNRILPPITAPSGASAEWIVERPAFVENGSLVLTQLADYGELNFTNAAATSDATHPKATTVQAATDSTAMMFSMLADDGSTTLSEETVTPALHLTFQQTAAGR